MTCSHWKNQMTTPSSSPRFSGQSDQITIGGRPVPFQSGVLPEDFAQRISRLKSASGLTWNGFALALGVDRRQVNRWREGTEPCGGAMLSLFRLALLIRGGLDILLGGDFQVEQDYQMSLWED